MSVCLVGWLVLPCTKYVKGGNKRGKRGTNSKVSCDSIAEWSPLCVTSVHWYLSSFFWSWYCPSFHRSRRGVIVLHKSRVGWDGRWLGLVMLLLILHDSRQPKDSCEWLLLLSLEHYSDARVAVRCCLVFVEVVPLSSVDLLRGSCWVCTMKWPMMSEVYTLTYQPLCHFWTARLC